MDLSCAFQPSSPLTKTFKRVECLLYSKAVPMGHTHCSATAALTFLHLLSQKQHPFAF